MEDKTIVELFALELYEKGLLTGNGDEIQESLERHAQMEKEQKEALYTAAEVKQAMIEFQDWSCGISVNFFAENYQSEITDIIKSLKTKES